MQKVSLTNAALDYIKVNGDNQIFSHRDGKVQVNRTLPKQRQISLPTIEKIINTTFIARDGEQIRSRIYIPKTTSKLVPAIVYYHGGGWVIGDIDYMDGGCQYLCQHSGAIVINIDYRLAPEFAYPTPFHDAYDGFLWAVKNELNLPIDPQAISVAGDSAGGNLAAAVASKSIEDNGPTILSQLLIYPALDATTTGRPSFERFGEGFGLNRDEMTDYYAHYVQNQEQLDHYTISPLLYSKKELLPPTIIISAEYDILNDEATQYIADLRQCGTDAEQYFLDGLIHSFYSKMDFFEEETSYTTSLLATFMHKQLSKNK